MRNKRIPSCALVIGLLLVGCSAQGTKSLSAESKMPELRPVIVQGATIEALSGTATGSGQTSTMAPLPVAPKTSRVAIVVLVAPNP